MADVRLTATNPDDSSVVPVACNEKGELKLEEPLLSQGPPGKDGDPFSGNFADDVTFGGNATFAGRILAPDFTTPGGIDLYLAASYQQGGIGDARGAGLFRLTDIGGTQGPQQAIRITQSGNQPNDAKVAFMYDGSATFAGNKAGFTAEGYLWCTTKRGDTVILDATSNGMGVWEGYTPATPRDDIRDQLENGSTTDIDSLRPKRD